MYTVAWVEVTFLVVQAPSPGNGHMHYQCDSSHLNWPNHDNPSQVYTDANLA